MYINYAIAAKKAPTFEDFCVWEKRHSENNKTFKLAIDFAFTTLHALNLFRCGIRNCNDDIAQAARERLAPLFFVSNTKKYQEIIAFDTLYLQTLSAADRSRLGMDSTRQTSSPAGEGFDFVMESRNKVYKSFLSNDVAPDFE